VPISLLNSDLECFFFLKDLLTSIGISNRNVPLLSLVVMCANALGKLLGLLVILHSDSVEQRI
jgi:hypothetical protein